MQIGAPPGASATTNKKKKSGKHALKVISLIIIFLAFAGMAYVGHKLYNLRKQRIEEKN